MALTNSQPNNINVPNGNGLVVYIDGETNQVYVRDVRGATEELNVLTESITTIIAEGGLTALKVGSVVTMGTDSSIIQLKAEKGQPNGYASLDSTGKLPVSELPVSVLTYEGMWNAATNTPFIQDGVGGAGDFYIVSVAGTQDLGSGPIRFEVSDWVIYNGSIWQRNSSELPDLQEVTDVGAVTTNAITTGGITTDYVQLDTTATPTLTVGMARWNTDQLTWEVGIGTGPIAYELGQSLYYPQVRNTSGTNLPKGTLVMVDPTDVSTGDRLNVIRAVANGTYISQLFVGILAEAINSNATGFAVWFGQVYNIANSAINLGGETWAEGDILYASAANPGGLTKVEPSAPNLKVTIAAIQAINGGNVNLLVRPWLNEDLGALNDVAISSPLDNSILQFNSSTGVWENVAGTTTNIAEGTNLYFTTARARESVSAGDGISYDSGTGVITNSDKGSSQDIFKNIAVATQSTITADTNNDTLTLAAGTNIGITTNATTDTITFSTINVPTGTGVANYLALWTSSSNLSTSLIYDTGSRIGINTTTPATTLDVQGVGTIRTRLSIGGDLDAFAAAVDMISMFGTANGSRIKFGANGTFVGNILSDSTQMFFEQSVPLWKFSSGANRYMILDAGNLILNTETYAATTGYKGITISGTTGSEIFLRSGATVNGRISASGSGIVVSSQTAEPVLLATTTGTHLTVNNSGQLTLDDYGVGTFTGTAAYNLAVDANGNIIETAGAVIDGSGTTNYVAKFTDSNSIGNSQIFDNGTNVGIGTATPSQLLHVAGAARITGSLYDSTNDPGSVTEFLSSTGSGTAWATAVTSVAFTVPTGFAIANSPITTSGTLGLSFAAGYSLPTNAKQTEWDTAYNDSITAFAYNTGTGVLTLTQQDLGTLTATVTLQPFTTTNLAEGTNLYYTDARARLSLSAGTGISYDNTTGVITNSDRGSSQFIFKNVAVTGSELIVADSNDDTITFTAGSGVTLSSSAATDTITISATGLGGTVTSVGLTAPTGFTVSGSPITTSGTLSIGFDTGYSLPTTAKQTNWDDAYDNKITASSFSSATGTLTLTQQDTGTLTTNFDGRYILLSEKAAANGVATLDGSGKIPSSQLPSSVFEYKGLWNAATNTPTLADGTGDPGDVYQCSVAGTVDFGSGPVTFAVGDLVIYDGTEWQKSDSTSEVLSVNGQVGVVVLTTTDIGEGTNLYYTDARARLAISGGTGITYNNTAGTITNADPGSSQAIFKNIEVAGQSTVTAEINNDTLTLVAGTNISITTNASTDTITINSTDQYAGTVTSVAMSVPTGFTISGSPITSAGTLGLAFASGYSLPTDSVQANWTTAYNRSLTAFAYNTSTGVLTLTEQDASTLTATITLQPFTTTNLAEGTNLYFTDARARGAISLTTTGTSGAATYNSTTGVLNIPQYQSAITNPVTGTGTTNYVAKWSSSSAITDSLIFDNGTNVGIGNSSPGQKLDITGNARVSSYYLFNGNPGNPGDSTASIYDQAGVGPTISGLNVAFRTGSTPGETMRIASDGNVGIGTVAPALTFEINSSTTAALPATTGSTQSGGGRMRLTTTGATTAVIDFGTAGGSGGWIQATNKADLTTNYPLLLNPNGGNVLIGTTTDSGEELVVNGNIGVPFSTQIRVAGGGFTRNDIISTGYNNVSDLKDYLILEAPGSSNGKIILGTGIYANVGIRNNTPQSALDVLAQGNTAGGTMMLSGSKTNNQVKYGVITTAQYASDTESEGVGLIGGTNTSTENIVNIGGGVDELNTATSIRFFAAANTTTRGSANERMRVNAANDAGNLYIGTTSTNDYGRLILNGFSGAWLPYIAGTSLSYNQYGIVVGNSNTANANIGGGLTLVNNTASVGAYGPVVSWSSMSAGGTYNSTYAFITGVYGGQGGDANWAIGDILFGTAETYGASERMRLRYNGNVLIGTTTDSGYKLRVNGSSYFDAPILCYTGNGYITAITSDGVGSNNGFGYSFLITGTNHEIGRVTGIYETSAGGGSGGLGFWTRASGTLSAKMTLNSGGTLTLSNYGAGTKTGTVAYNLAVDASGNVIETAGGVVDGSGTANYVTKWQDANTVTNSSITDDGTTVTATAANFVSQSNLGTAYTSFTTSGTTAIFDTITRTNAAIYQIVIVANPNSAGSSAYADFYYGKVFIGTGFNGSAVVDVINYHQESPLPRGLYGSGGGDLTVTAVMLVGGSEVTEVAANTSYTIRIKIAGYVVAGSNTTVRLQRIM